jgi:formylglycine-generating enzyme required for sulfatase activity
MKLNLIVFSFFYGFVSLTCFSSAQSISNITASQSGKNIAINYTLIGKEGIAVYEIKLYVSLDDGNTWKGPLTAVNGEVGTGQVGGYNKSISWDVLNEPGFTQLKGDKIHFKITAYNNIANNVDIEMVWVQTGNFMMGNDEGEEDEKPLHEVSLKGFYIGKYEVTQEQWLLVMRNNPSENITCLKCPVTNVSWDDIQTFINRLNVNSNKKYRLPTEAEWEYAAKGGSENIKFKYAGSNDIDAVAWYGGNSNGLTHQVGTKKANSLGIFDMTGNVWEWCNDWYDKHYYQYSAKSNPAGTSTGSFRVLRGGSFSYNISYLCTPSDRYYSKSYGAFNYIGFRLAKD